MMNTIPLNRIAFEQSRELEFFDEKELKEMLNEFTDEMFLDWAKVIYRYWTKQPVEFRNPLLNELFIG